MSQVPGLGKGCSSLSQASDANAQIPPTQGKQEPLAKAKGSQMLLTTLPNLTPAAHSTCALSTASQKVKQAQ